MANSYTQLYTQIIFAVSKRENLIKENFREELEKYISGIISKKKSKLLAIYCNPDHVHIFISIHPDISVSDMVGEIKTSSSSFINSKNWMNGHFNWQKGFGAFSYSKSQINKVVTYILNQPEHHKKNSFKDEYVSFLKKFEIEYNEGYLFEWFE